KHFLMKLTRAKLEELVEEYIARSVQLVKETVTAAPPKGAGLKLEDIDEIIMVGGQTRMPAVRDAVKKLFGKEPHLGINPDEVVAIGAATQAGILQGDIKDVLLLDVTPLSLGIETLGAVSTVLIPKNTTIPTAKSQIFSTAADNQTSVEIHVLQGERPMATDNKTLARFILDGIPPAPRGMPQVEVTFDVDANGILNVTAHDKATGKKQSVRVEASTALSKEEVERLAREAESHAGEDRRKKELAESKNHAETLIYTAEKSLRDAGDKVANEIKEEITGKAEALRQAMAGEDKSLIDTRTAELGSSLQKIGEALYKDRGTDAEDAPPQE
ncbi:MAG: Hsp70 family protein, partial [Candidatus Colwellbacteria bacterium]|nr:Hsp70 family protein [Candidatus Colwellbacteria bacterium]